MLRILAIIVGLSGCSDRPIPAESHTEFSIGQGSEHVVPFALDRTRDQFFATSGQSAQAYTAGSARMLDDPEDLFDFDRANYTREDYYDIGLRHHRSFELAGPVRYWVEIGADLSHIDYSLPEGLSILEDPIRLSVRAQSVELAGGVALAGGTLFSYQPDLSLGLGRSRARISTRLSSNLLDVRSRLYLTDGFVHLGLRAGRDRKGDTPPLALETRLRAYDQTDYALHVRLQIGFGR